MDRLIKKIIITVELDNTRILNNIRFADQESVRFDFSETKDNQ